MAKLSRRAVLRAALLSLPAGLGIYSYALEPGWLDVVRLDMPLRGLPDAFAGFTIAQISDLHFGALVGPSHIDPVVKTVQNLGADAVVITGDLVSRVTGGEPDMIVATLSRLQAPQGVYAVLGNHDWSANGYLVTQALRRAGITVLENENVSWRRDGQSLYLAGIGDFIFAKNDIERSLAGIPPDAAIAALVHEPDYADIVARDPRIILQLSGHSHGGQICLPFIGSLFLPPFARKYTSGMYRVQDLTLYTNRGIGVIGVPLRFACRPEVTLFTLKPAN